MEFFFVFFVVPIFRVRAILACFPLYLRRFSVTTIKPCWTFVQKYNRETFWVKLSWIFSHGTFFRSYAKRDLVFFRSMFTLTHLLFVARLFEQNILSEKVSQSTNSLWEAILTWWFLSYGVVRPVFRVRVPFPLNSDDWRLQRKTLVEHWFQSKGFKWLGCYASVDELSDGFVYALINWSVDGGRSMGCSMVLRSMVGRCVL